MENNEIEKKLESKNVKPTAMRTLVYKTLADSGKALSLADLEKRFEKVERSTIFRALKSFEDNFIVHTVDDGSGSVKYAVAMTIAHVIYMTCTFIFIVPVAAEHVA